MRKNTVEYYKKLLTGNDKDDIEVLKKIGELYYTGSRKNKQDFSQAVQYLKRASDAGDDEAMLLIARCYSEGGHGIDQDADLAFRYCKGSANRGNKDAMYLLSQMYSEGKGTTKDDRDAAYWLDRSGRNLKPENDTSGTAGTQQYDTGSSEKNVQKNTQGKSAGAKEGKTPANTEGSGEPDIGGGGPGGGSAEGEKKNKLPLFIVLGIVLAGIATFLIVYLNMFSKSNVIIVDNEGNPVSGSQTSDSQGNNSSGETKATIIEIDPIIARSSAAEPADIVYGEGSITTKGEEDIFDYTTPRDGRYRIEMSDMPASMKVDLSFHNPDGEVVEEKKDCGNGQGVTVKNLVGNTEYTINIKHNSGNGNYRIVVGEQKPTPDITDLTQIDDSVEYTDQRNLYNFVVPHDGRYRFELSGLASGDDTDMYIFNDPGEKISENLGCGNGDGLTLDNVREGEIYEIQVRQKNGYSGYSLNIGQQKETVNISSRSVVTDSMEYTDQRNVYSFNASSAGKVTFTLSDMGSDMAVEVVVKDDNGNTIASGANCRNGSSVSINDVTQGSHYFVQVVQGSGLGSYIFTVE